MRLNITRSLPHARALLNQTLPDLALITRTGLTVHCRVDAPGATRPFPGLPSFVEIPVWDFTLPMGTDLAANDFVTVSRTADDGVTVLGTRDYFITAVFDPVSYPVSTDATAIVVSNKGHGKLPIDPPVTVTFQHNRHPNLTLQADAYVYPADKDIIEYGLSPQLRWGVIYDPALTYSNGDKPAADHLIFCAEALGVTEDGDPKSATISNPRRTVGLLPTATAYFGEAAT